MERFVIIVNGFHPFTIITKHSILDVAASLDPPLDILEDKTNMLKLWKNIAHSVHFQRKIRNKIWQWLLFLLLLIPMVKKNLPNLANNFHSPILFKTIVRFALLMIWINIWSKWQNLVSFFSYQSNSQQLFYNYKDLPLYQIAVTTVNNLILLKRNYSTIILIKKSESERISFKCVWFETVSVANRLDKNVSTFVGNRQLS